MPRSRQTTIRDLARELQVSHTTVSRALNGKGEGFISEETRRKVMETAARMNYRPHRVARALATGRTGMIALWVEDLRQPYAVSIMNHVLSQVNDPCVELVIRAMRPMDTTPQEVAQWHVDGILALDGVDYLRSLSAQGLTNCPPLVAMGDPPRIEVDHVGVDLYAGAVEAVRHLVAAGCRRIAFFTNDWGNREDEARYAGYTSTMQAAGRDPEYIVMTGNTREAARETIRAYVTREGCPDGLFCLSDAIAISAYRGLLDLQLRVPEDVALVGCDGLRETEYLERPLTTIVQPFDAMSALAWQFLRQRMEDPSLPIQRRILAPRLEVRASSLR
ncbi:MAG TPA: LacI family DNA-binding transcriptional regulator [Chthonomonadaceae bacterium]|nr:LacI family DNA-binding transcriptional regulator [Chthonomonadaceae bacterium]